ncbi:NADH dehydrogenase FAD-containing subunit [Desulfobaculum xiamenense]|uniref:NADH dehydrogenase FAD-containing subunit n=1 Tax=Desulfobaculum xiamenense TaxID=995050 RepID=A0A846QLX5_9BACT|nr:FAD-dependent oxidoreductase [Desulfobaculum xiamenense]NJB68030.1 NADH dehydrogenase FAD-containing subunit [Desulfobaculum xiamenense]
MGGHLVLAGGGHAHVAVIARLAEFIGRGHRVTVVSPAPEHHYSGMGPGMLGGFYTPRDISFPVEAMTRASGGQFVRGYVVRVDAPARRVLLDDGSHLDYDVLSLNVGSEVPAPGATQGPQPGVYPVKPIANLLAARDDILSRLEVGPAEVLVVGGGPAALEVAGNLWACARRFASHAQGRMPRIRVLAGRHFLPRLPARVRRMARASLEGRGIAIVEHGYATDISTGHVTLENHEVFEADVIMTALGVRPPRFIADSGLPVGPDGGLRVDRFLRSERYPNILGGGDCIHFAERPLDKVGVYAVRQHGVLPHNILAALEDSPPKAFEPGGRYLLVYNLGDGTGIFRKGPLVFGGTLAWWLKDRIDRRFMRRFLPKD